MEKFNKHLKEFDPIIIAEAHLHDIPGMDWQDIAQEIRIHLWNKFDLFDVKKSSFKTWANRVMKNRIKNLIRDANTKSHQYINRAISIEELQEKELEDNE